ncbi:Drug/Metabolite Transporter (DMT) Superfamily [Phytophthora cinnamomi]|uniref:Drug/Metabolite Transporter (DMT) Superfamily n=1 Tax=Phytophthora cinnamomi TaxID=4785 RepID=UPI0035593CBF|nr:Drug/Metabolite Transporter (DMT) Superfamily [Phytophthora cinnamomi]
MKGGMPIEFGLDDKEAPLLPRAALGTKLNGVPGNRSLLGLASVAASALCFSVMTTLIKYQTFSMTSMEAIFWRSTGAFVFNLVTVLSVRKSLYVPPKKRLMLALRCLSGFSSIAFAFYAISQMVLADASAIVFISPVLTFFAGACFLHERIDPVSLLSAIFAFSGLVFVVRPSFLFGSEHASDITGASWDAVGAALLGALGQVFVFITVRKLQGVHALVIVHYFMLSSAVVALGWVQLVQKTFVVPQAFDEWRAIVGCGLFTFLGQMFLTKGFQLEKAGIASVMRYFDVVFVFIWDSAILKERINHWSVVGAAIIVTSAAVIAVRKMKQR